MTSRNIPDIDKLLESVDIKSNIWHKLDFWFLKDEGGGFYIDELRVRQYPEKKEEWDK